MHVKQRHVIRLRFGEMFFTFLTKFVFEAKASTCSIIKENVLLYCRKFLAFAIVVIV